MAIALYTISPTAWAKAVLELTLPLMIVPYTAEGASVQTCKGRARSASSVLGAEASGQRLDAGSRAPAHVNTPPDPHQPIAHRTCQDSEDTMLTIWAKTILLVSQAMSR